MSDQKDTQPAPAAVPAITDKLATVMQQPSSAAVQGGTVPSAAPLLIHPPSPSAEGKSSQSLITRPPAQPVALDQLSCTPPGSALSLAGLRHYARFTDGSPTFRRDALSVIPKNACSTHHARTSPSCLRVRSPREKATSRDINQTTPSTDPFAPAQGMRPILGCMALKWERAAQWRPAQDNTSPASESAGHASTARPRVPDDVPPYVTIAGVRKMAEAARRELFARFACELPFPLLGRATMSMAADAPIEIITRYLCVYAIYDSFVPTDSVPPVDIMGIRMTPEAGRRDLFAVLVSALPSVALNGLTVDMAADEPISTITGHLCTYAIRKSFFPARAGALDPFSSMSLLGPWSDTAGSPDKPRHSQRGGGSVE